jgi:endoglucanase
MSSRRLPKALGGAVLALALAAGGAVVVSTVTAQPALAAGTGTGFLHTSGNKIVDSTGATVRLTGINWFGMETDNHTFHGLWAGRPATWTQQLTHMAQLGFNTIRVPYTGVSLQSGTQATSVNTDSNPDLVGLSPLQILDKVVNFAGSLGMRVFLDRHRPTTARQTALWNGDGVSEASEIADWQMLAQHFAGNSTVVGADLFNEPHADGTDPQGVGADWGTGDARDWRLAAERMGNAILSVNPNWLIIVEGVSCNLPSGGTPNGFDNIPDDPMACDWWGGNLSLAGQFPVRLNVANRLVYSAHDYALSVFPGPGQCDTSNGQGQPWFRDPAFPSNLPAVWDHFWGYLAKQNIAPVLVGEFGSLMQCAKDQQWMNALVSYIMANGLSFTYWSWNPDSADTGGIVGDDWNTVQTARYNVIQPALVPPSGGGGGTGTPTGTGTRTGPPPTTATQPTGTCTATFSLTNSWDGGFQGEVTVHAGTTAINGWTVTWTLASGQSITQLWNGAPTTNGSTETVKNLSYNGSIAANATTAFGFTAGGPASTPALSCTSP